MAVAKIVLFAFVRTERAYLMFRCSAAGLTVAEGAVVTVGLAEVTFLFVLVVIFAVFFVHGGLAFGLLQPAAIPALVLAERRNGDMLLFHYFNLFFVVMPYCAFQWW